jgi:hypothetical protein
MFKEQVLNIAKAFGIDINNKTKNELEFDIGLECRKLANPLQVQSILFPKVFQMAYIVGWLKRFKVHHLKVTEEKNFTRVKIIDISSRKPRLYKKMLSNGITLVLIKV